MIPFAANAATTATVKIANAFEWHGQPPKIATSPRGSAPPSNTWFLEPTRVFTQNGISIGSAVFVWVPNAMLYNALSTGKKTPETAPLPWDLFTWPDEDRDTATDNKHKIWQRSCVSFGTYAHGQTDTQTNRQTYSLQYFSTAPMGEVFTTCNTAGHR